MGLNKKFPNLFEYYKTNSRRLTWKWSL